MYRRHKNYETTKDAWSCVSSTWQEDLNKSVSDIKIKPEVVRKDFNAREIKIETPKKEGRGGKGSS